MMRNNKRGRGESGSKNTRLSPIARELNPEEGPVGNTTRYARSIAGDAFVGGDPVKQYASGRICEAPGCTTRLSRYNPTNFCSEHPETKMLIRTPKVVRIDSKSIRKSRSKAKVKRRKK